MLSPFLSVSYHNWRLIAANQIPEQRKKQEKLSELLVFMKMECKDYHVTREGIADIDVLHGSYKLLSNSYGSFSIT